MEEYLGDKPKFVLVASDIKTIGDWHTKGLRVLWCLVNGKASVKDSTPLPPADVVEFDGVYGDLLQPINLAVWMMDKQKEHPNKSGKLIPGALKLRCQLSHVAAAIVALAAVKTDGRWELDDEIVEFCFSFFRDMLDEDNEDESSPAVCLRNCLDNFRLNSMTNQHVKFTVLQLCLMAAVEIETLGETKIDFDVESLAGYVVGKNETAARVYFGTELDHLKDSPETVASGGNGGNVDDKDVAEFDDEDEE